MHTDDHRFFRRATTSTKSIPAITTNNFARILADYLTMTNTNNNKAGSSLVNQFGSGRSLLLLNAQPQPFDSGTTTASTDASFTHLVSEAARRLGFQNECGREMTTLEILDAAINLHDSAVASSLESRPPRVPPHQAIGRSYQATGDEDYRDQ